MHALVIGACFLASLLVTFSRNAGSAFAVVYLPSLLLLSRVSSLELPGLPDASPAAACVYGILLGGLLARRRPRIRLGSVDIIVALLLVQYVISGVLTEYLYTGVSVFGSFFLELVGPYFIVRCSVRQRKELRLALVALIASIVVIALFAVIEMRLWPHYYASLLSSLGLGDFSPGRPLMRFGFFRARSAFPHAIDLGNSSGLVLAITYVVALQSGIGTKTIWVRGSLALALIAAICGLSFTPYAGLGAGLSLFLALRRLPVLRRFLVLVVLVVMTVGYSYASYTANAPLPERPPEEDVLASSTWVRKLIIKQAWRAAGAAGFFGLGGDLDIGELMELKSLDNAYLRITINRGKGALLLVLSLPIGLALVASRALRRARSGPLSRSIQAGFCAIVGAMVAMFTVSLIGVYPSLLLIAAALTVNGAEAVLSQRAEARAGRLLPQDGQGASMSAPGLR
jgi:hypothetical protein